MLSGTLGGLPDAGGRRRTRAWVVACRTHVRLGRKVAFASDNREVIFISTPVPRTQIPVQPRRAIASLQGTKVAETGSTHESCYMNVPPLPWGALPMVTKADKTRILGITDETDQTPRTGLYDTTLGLPLYWNDRKSSDWWACLFGDLNAKSVVDLTPGNGCAARAAMESGIQYVGIARNQEHASWLQNVADRNALRLICTTNSALYHSDLSTSINEHFADVLDQLQEADKSTDAAPAADVEIDDDEAGPQHG